jgi:hypothetical protein
MAAFLIAFHRSGKISPLFTEIDIKVMILRANLARINRAGHRYMSIKQRFKQGNKRSVQGLKCES